ncbi:MAG TPA: OmpA family protein [Usitatibacter sp.]|nr:OmpA family protein [Usitatibacter sp.]
MIRASLLAAALAASAIGTTPAIAQERGYRDGAPSHWDRGAYRHDHRHPHYAPRYVPRYVPARPYAYVDPLWLYPAPPLVYSYPVYEPPPVVVERIYEPAPRIYEAPPQRRYEERSYAQIAPDRPAPPPAEPAPVPRLERYTLSAKELFGFDEATIRGSNAKLDEIADVMKRNPRIDHVTITGYTDRIGGDAYNLKLSQRRAQAVKDYLVARGVAAGRLATVGKGKANPVVQCNDKDRAQLIRCLEPNRRVEVEQITIERRAR